MYNEIPLVDETALLHSTLLDNDRNGSKWATNTSFQRPGAYDGEMAQTALRENVEAPFEMRYDHFGTLHTLSPH